MCVCVQQSAGSTRSQFDLLDESIFFPINKYFKLLWSIATLMLPILSQIEPLKGFNFWFLNSVNFLAFAEIFGEVKFSKVPFHIMQSESLIFF